jgi:membrane-bound serine protease (ClpP class)
MAKQLFTAPIIRGVKTRLLLPVFVLLVLAAGLPAFAHDSHERIDVVRLEGAIDNIKLDYLIDAINGAAAEGAQAVILEIDSPGAVTSEITTLLDLLESPPLPIVAWVGDAPAEAQGAAARILEIIEVATIAPGAVVGHSDILIIGESPDGSSRTFSGAVVVAGGDTPGVDRAEAALGQIVVWLHGQEINGRTLDTAEQVIEDGTATATPTAVVRFVEPSALRNMLAHALKPGTLFFLLSIALTVMVFEFYAIGPGVGAATALLPLLVASYGLATLPLSFWALGALLLGILLMAIEYQRSKFGLLSTIGAVLLFVGGLKFVDGAPTLAAHWGSVLTTTLLVVIFFAVAMPAVARTRFSTGTYGREHLVGREGVTTEAFSNGAGVVSVDGALWRATSHRELTLEEGSPITVTGVQGSWLDVSESP